MQCEHKNRGADGDLRFMLRLGAASESLKCPSSATPAIRAAISPLIQLRFVIELELQFQLVNLYKPQRPLPSNCALDMRIKRALIECYAQFAIFTLATS